MRVARIRLAAHKRQMATGASCSLPPAQKLLCTSKLGGARVSYREDDASDGLGAVQFTAWLCVNRRISTSDGCLKLEAYRSPWWVPAKPSYCVKPI